MPSKSSTSRKKLVRRSVQEARDAQAQQRPKSVSYKDAVPADPPEVEPHLQNDRVSSASEASHTTQPQDGHQDYVPARGSSLSWEAETANQNPTSNLPIQLKNSSKDASSPPQERHTGSKSSRLPNHIEHVLHDQPDSATRVASDQNGTSINPGASHEVDPHIRDKLNLHTEETIDVERKVAQPVTHETIRPHTHHIIRKEITREIHTYDIYNRILPLVEFEVLPAKHFFKNSAGQLIPITEAEVSRLENSVGLISYTITPTVTTRGGKDGVYSVDEAFEALKTFSARPIQPHEREIRRWVDEKGVERSEQWHFYRPKILGVQFVDDIREALPKPTQTQ